MKAGLLTRSDLSSVHKMTRTKCASSYMHALICHLVSVLWPLPWIYFVLVDKQLNNWKTPKNTSWNVRIAYGSLSCGLRCVQKKTLYREDELNCKHYILIVLSYSHVVLISFTFFLQIFLEERKLRMQPTIKWKSCAAEEAFFHLVKMSFLFWQRLKNNGVKHTWEGCNIGWTFECLYRNVW